MRSLLKGDTPMATRAKTTALKTAESPTDLRLAIPNNTLSELGLDLNTWKVLTESIFPSAKTAEGILLAVRYCQARGSCRFSHHSGPGRPRRIVPSSGGDPPRRASILQAAGRCPWPSLHQLRVNLVRPCRIT